jgi:hypothetical protein
MMGTRSGVDIALLVLVALLGLLTLPEVFTANATSGRVVAALVLVGCAIYVGMDLRQARRGVDETRTAVQRSALEASDDAHTQGQAQSQQQSVPLMVGLGLLMVVTVAGGWFLDQLGIELLPLLLLGPLIAVKARARTAH